MTIENHEILGLIPHRPPFLLVDKVTDFVKDVSCVGHKFIGSNEWFFQGHFPSNPVMPGVLQVEAIAQTACVLVAKSFELGSGNIPTGCLFASIDRARFKKPVRPGSQLKMEVKLLKIMSSIAVFSGTGSVDGEVVVEVEFKAAFENPEFTLGIIKPDAVRNGHIEEILNLLETNGIKVASQKLGNFVVPMQKRMKISLEQAKAFYEIHSARPFYNDLCEFMSSGDSFVMVLQGQNVVEKYREIMGATNPASADEGTIRKLYGISIDENSVHGSDSKENAVKEIRFFFEEFRFA